MCVQEGENRESNKFYNFRTKIVYYDTDCGMNESFIRISIAVPWKTVRIALCTEDHQTY